MSVVKMDMSEYQEMLEHKQSLKDALVENKKNLEIIEKLKQEKIDALEQNSKKVTIVKEKRIYESKLVKRSYTDWIKRFMLAVGSQGSRATPTEYDYDYAINMFFDTIQSGPAGDYDYKQVTTQGLDDVRKEIRDDLEKSLTDEHKKNRQLVETLRNDNDKVHTKYIELEKRNKDLQSEFNELEEDYNSISYASQDRRELIEEIETIINSNINITNYISKIRKIKKIITKQNNILRL